MAWQVTLHIVDCTATSHNLAGAAVNDGSNVWHTDANGQLIYVVFDDTVIAVIVQISVLGYISANYAISVQNNGTIQQVCLNPSPTGTGDPNQPTGQGPAPAHCFIVSATTGSADSAEVARLRHLRDRVAAVSPLAGRLIDMVYDDYFQFSPGIAAQIERDVIARNAVLYAVVRPLLAWYTLAGVVALDRHDPKTVDKAVREVVDACPGYLGRRSILSLLQAFVAGDALPADTSPLLLDFAPRVRKAASLPFASWGILDPLVRAWRAVADHRDMLDEVAQWLSAAPLDALSVPSDPEILDRQLAVLAGFLEFNAMARRQLGERLMVAWPDAASALERVGFLS